MLIVLIVYVISVGLIIIYIEIFNMTTYQGTPIVAL